jgi:hypothetical protein
MHKLCHQILGEIGALDKPPRKDQSIPDDPEFRPRPEFSPAEYILADQKAPRATSRREGGIRAPPRWRGVPTIARDARPSEQSDQLVNPPACTATRRILVTAPSDGVSRLPMLIKDVA